MDSKNAPAQLRAILLKENPLWKLPERRVARYLKRHLKARKNPTAEEIEVDEDEATIYTTTSAMVKEPTMPEKLTNEEVTDKMVVIEDAGKTEDNSKVEEEPQDKPVGEEEKETEPITANVSLMDEAINEEDENENQEEVVEGSENEKPSDNVNGETAEVQKDVYADDNDKTSDGPACFGEGCIIS